MLKFKKTHLLLSVAAVIVLLACSPKTAPPENQLVGNWELIFLTDSVAIPTRLLITNDSVFLRNGIEIIGMLRSPLKGDTLELELPHYDTVLRLFTDHNGLGGEWINTHKDNYSIPVSAQRTSMTQWQKQTEHRSRYSCVFANEGEKVVGLFNFDRNPIEGTFLTETGDYRFLEGVKKENTFYLSCFDGAHLFYFSGIHRGDSILSGRFFSGKHYSDHWVAVKNESAKLNDPDSLSFWIDKNTTPTFKALSASMDTVVINEQTFLGRVTALSLVGTWCPNCTDLERFLMENKGLQQEKLFRFIPVCFETGNDPQTAWKRIEKHFKPYTSGIMPLFGGPARKSAAQELLPQLSQVTAFPTTILVDKTGKVRHVHTGFYGPGTGEYYTRYSTRLLSQINTLLAELP